MLLLLLQFCLFILLSAWPVLNMGKTNNEALCAINIDVLEKWKFNIYRIILSAFGGHGLFIAADGVCG